MEVQYSILSAFLSTLLTPLLDPHTRNLAFTIPSLSALRQENFLQKLGPAEKGLVRRKGGQQLGSGLPRYLVRPTS